MLHPRTMHSGRANHSNAHGNTKIRNYYIITLLHVIIFPVQGVCFSYLYVFILSYIHTFIQVTRTILWGKKTILWGRKTIVWGKWFFGVEMEGVEPQHVTGRLKHPRSTL